MFYLFRQRGGHHRREWRDPYLHALFLLFWLLCNFTPRDKKNHNLLLAYIPFAIQQPPYPLPIPAFTGEFPFPSHTQNSLKSLTNDSVNSQIPRILAGEREGGEVGRKHTEIIRLNISNRNQDISGGFTLLET